MLPSPAARLGANLQVTGARGGHDLHYRTLQTMGVQLLGRLTGVKGHHARFADDLADSVAFGDARYADIRAALRNQLAAKAMPVPDLPDPPPFAPTTRAGCASQPSSMPWASRSPTRTPAR
jgi:putative flavoprotein involved in K+ transport